MPLQYDAEWLKLAGPGLEVHREVLPVHDVKNRRIRYEKLFQGAKFTLPDDVEVKIYHTPAEDGHQIAIYHVFKKGEEKAAAPGPALLHIHGGGYFSVSAKNSLPSIALLVSRGGVPMFSVDYRLAPENPFPIPLNDCWSALQYVQSVAGQFNIDVNRIGVMGESAGGGLAAGLALFGRDQGFSPPLAKQILIYPMLDDRTVVDSTEGLGVFSLNDVITGWSAYLGKSYGTTSVSQYAAAARAETVKGLPPLYLDVGQIDMFAKENLTYAARFVEADMEAEVHLYPGVIHAFQRWSQGSYVVRQAITNRLRAITTF